MGKQQQLVFSTRRGGFMCVGEKSTRRGVFYIEENTLQSERVYRAIIIMLKLCTVNV